MRISIFVQRISGRWEASWHSRDEGRTFRFTSHDQEEAIAKAVRATGYLRRDCNIVLDNS